MDDLTSTIHLLHTHTHTHTHTIEKRYIYSRSNTLTFKSFVSDFPFSYFFRSFFIVPKTYYRNRSKDSFGNMKKKGKEKLGYKVEKAGVAFELKGIYMYRPGCWSLLSV